MCDTSKQYPRAVAALAVVVLAAACSGGTTVVSSDATTTTTTAVETTTTTAATTTTTAITTTTTVVTTTTEPEPFEWTLMAGGDVLMDRTAPAGIDPFASLEPHLSTADLAMVNVEMTISDRGTAIAGKTYTFRAPPIAADIIAEAGIDLATVANNHARDYGTDAFIDTMNLLSDAGVTVLGAGNTDTEAYTPKVVTLGHSEQEVSVAFIAASLVMPWGFGATTSRPGIADGNDRNRVLANVRVAAESNDVVIVTLHWGIERNTCPEPTHVTFANQLLDAGATAVIGHHPHVLQPVEFEDGKLIAFSLGNFAWHPRSTITADTGILELQFTDANLTGFDFHPHVLGTNGKPEPVGSGARFDRINEIVSGQCEKHDPPPVVTTTTVADATTTTTTVADATTTTVAAAETTTTTAATAQTTTTTSQDG
ncbi:MAG: CapA family protein [Actinomycetia bacterium]|nr:CapA family protein [Actinomycetes bacterium]